MKTLRLFLMAVLCASAMVFLMADGTPGVPVATATRLGVIKVDNSTTTVDADGTLHAAGGGGPTNGITSAQAGAQIQSTNNAFIQPAINAASNSVEGDVLKRVATNNGVAFNPTLFIGNQKLAQGDSFPLFNIIPKDASSLASGIGWQIGDGPLQNDWGAASAVLITSNTSTGVITVSHDIVDERQAGIGITVELSTDQTHTNVSISTEGDFNFQDTQHGSFAGDGSGMTNMTHGPTVSAGSNIAVTRTRNADGSTNTAVAVADPLSLNAANVSTLTVTNQALVTNDLSGVTVINLATGSEGTMALSGDVTIVAFTNAQAGVYNKKLVDVLPKGANRAVAVPASWQTNYNCTGVVSNGQVGHFLFWMQLGAFTNWMQLNAR